MGAFPSEAACMKQEAILVREWGAEAFHERVLKLEKKGYITRLETYRITPEMNPDTGEIINLHTIEMLSQAGNE